MIVVVKENNGDMYLHVLLAVHFYRRYTLEEKNFRESKNNEIKGFPFAKKKHICEWSF